MNSKNIIIAALILTTLAGGVYGWTQYRRANNLQAQVAKYTAKTTAKHTPRPAGDAKQTPADPKKTPDKSKPTDDPSDAPRMQMPSSGALRNLMQSPKAAPLIASQQRVMIENRYASLFKSLNLPPDQLAKFKDLLVEKQNSARDVLTVAREQGLDFRNSNDRSEIQQLIQQSQADVDTGITALIGADKFAQYQNYDQTAPQRAVVGQVEQRLSYTSEPLSAAQSDQLVALLAQNTPAANAGSGSRTFVFNIGGMGPMSVGGQNVPITNDVINAAQSFLTPNQVDALRQMQTEQADQQQLQKMLQNGGGGNSGNSGNSKYKSKNKSHHGGGGGN